jgi:hypothetical protein
MARFKMRQTVGVLTVLAVLLLVVACGAEPVAREQKDAREYVSGTTDSSSDARVFFPQTKGAGGTPDAASGGRLIVDDKGCLRVKWRGGSEVPVWPSSYELRTKGEEVEILNGKGRVVARVGQEVATGGGQIPEGVLRGNDVMEERPLRELLKRCPGNYFLLGSIELDRSDTQDNSSSDTGVFFPQTKGAGDMPAGMSTGRLIVDDEGCLRVKWKGGSEVPVWPWDFELRKEGEEIQILNGKGRVVARVGERVITGGGELPEGALRGTTSWRRGRYGRF